MTASSKTQKPLLAMFAPNLEGGGAERVLVNLAYGLCERGFPVDVVLASATGAFVSELPRAVRVVDLRKRRVALSVPALSKYLRQQRPHSLISFLDHANVTAICAGFIAGNRSRIVVSVHGMWPLTEDRPQYSWKNRVLTRFAHHAYKRAHAVVAVSNDVADSLAMSIGIERERISVVYNPVITPTFLQRSSEPEVHPWLNAGEPPVIVGMGSLYPVKDFPTLLRAFAKVRAQLSCRLMIMGEGVRRRELECLAEDLGVEQDVLLSGFIANPYPNLKRARVFVLSSIREGLGNVLIEALALGVPCIATHCKGGPSEILAGGKYGLLTPVGDVDAMAAAIVNTFQHPRAVVPETAWQLFTLATATDAYERILA
jgi:glycosyltransferase involved in cell wall biosynthesis